MADTKRGYETPEWGTLWCCHVVGPDDLHAARDFEHAVAMARQINERFKNNPADENDPVLRGEVTLWPWDAETHAADLAKAQKETSHAV